MIFIISLICISIFLLYKFPFIGLFIVIIFVIYPYLVNKYNSSSNFLYTIHNLIKNWIKTGSIEISNIKNDSNVSSCLATGNIEIGIGLKPDTQSNKKENQLFKLFPELELYQNWLYDNQEYYIKYKNDVVIIWQQIINKIMDITNNQTYISNDINDLFNLQGQLLKLFEFQNNLSTNKNQTYILSIIETEIINRNRSFNTNLVKWINNKYNNNMEKCHTLTDFNVSDWVSPSNLMPQI